MGETAALAGTVALRIVRTNFATSLKILNQASSRSVPTGNHGAHQAKDHTTEATTSVLSSGHDTGAAARNCRVVRPPWLETPRPSAGIARCCTRAALDTAHCSDRRGQDARRFLAEPRRARRRKAQESGAGLFTLYISPLKALATDVERNLIEPIGEMGLKIRTETRTGDTSVARRQRQRVKPPQILLTTPEQVALLLSHPDAPHLFADLDTVILDELHALAASKRGDLLALDLARLRTLAPNMMTIGLSATVARPSELRGYLVAQSEPETVTLLSDLVTVEGGAKPEISILEVENDIPWSGHTARYAMREVYDAIRAHKLTLVFVNARLQAESPSKSFGASTTTTCRLACITARSKRPQRRKVEAAMADGRLRAVVATSTLDLGIDWGDVDLVIHLGPRKAPAASAPAHRPLQPPSRRAVAWPSRPRQPFRGSRMSRRAQAAEAGAQDATLSRVRHARRSRTAHPRHGL